MAFNTLSVLVLLTAGLVYYFAVYRLYEEVIVDTQFGKLKGFKAFSRDGRPYNAFKSIPYAKPPVGELRFQAPVENGKWAGVKDATYSAPLCFQADPVWRRILGQEDCLYLNVFTPKLPSKKVGNLLPVMFFIHGGYFMFGGTDLYDPAYFMDEDVVIVTIHYRLGALGFLSTGDAVVSGNMGLKDQLMALKWVKATIKDFGGDPNQITLFGESAGGGSVHFHMFSPLSRGLFQRAISESGTSLNSWADQTKDRRSQANELGKKLNCPTESSEKLLKCLNSKDAKEIYKTHQFVDNVFYESKDIYGPTLEKGVDKSKAFLTKSTRQMYEDEDVAKIPWLTGVNAMEGCWRSIPILVNEEASDQLQKGWNTLAPVVFMYKNDNSASEKIHKFYFGDSKAKSKQFSMKDYDILTNAISDRYFNTGLGEAARFHVKHAPTYLYYFTHSDPEGLGMIAANSKGILPAEIELLAAKIKLTFYKFMNWEVPDYGACHADELQYLFITFPLTGIWKSHKNYEFSKSFVKMWVNFAKNGYPGKFNGVEWTKAEPNKPPRYMHIGSPAQMIDEPFTERSKFWQGLKLTTV